MWIKTGKSSFNKMHLKMFSAKRAAILSRPQCVKYVVCQTGIYRPLLSWQAACYEIIWLCTFGKWFVMNLFWYISSQYDLTICFIGILITESAFYCHRVQLCVKYIYLKPKFVMNKANFVISGTTMTSVGFQCCCDNIEVADGQASVLVIIIFITSVQWHGLISQNITLTPVFFFFFLTPVLTRDRM